MQGFPRAPGAGDPIRARRAAGLLAALAGLLATLVAAPALASDPGPLIVVPGEPGPTDRVFCTPLGCRGPAPASWSHAAGFGAAVLGVAWLARSRSGAERTRS